MILSIEGRSKIVREEALKLGFDLVGYSKAEELDESANRLRSWLDKGSHGDMYYMENHFEKRVDPCKLVENAKTVISLSYNYYTAQKQSSPDAPIISTYAFGRDYHKVLKKKLKTLLSVLKEKIGVVDGRALVDSAPVLEREWAKRAGLGWIGKNTLLIVPGKGSYFFLSELIIDVELEYNDRFVQDHCGRCRKCIDACPTDAISVEGYIMDGSKCISYATIEKKGDIPESFVGKMENRVFGCDICMEVCPWNRFAKEHDEKDFLPKAEMLKLAKRDWDNMENDHFETLFNGTPLRRAGYDGMKRNVKFLNKKADNK